MSSLIVPAHYAKNRKVNREKTARLREAMRPSRVTQGGWVDRLASRCNAIVLCRAHQSKFDYRKHGYYKDRKFPWVQGRCSACGEYDTMAALYIHEKFLTDPNGKTSSGQCWTPK